MRIIKVVVELNTEEKINKKHGVYLSEIKEALLNGSPVFFRAKGNRYLAIGFKGRYITIIFSYKQKVARIVTAYPSSDWQIKLYKRRRLGK